MEFNEGDNLICVVEKIENNVVLVKTLYEGIKGTIISSEIAAGRIKNIREFVVPNKIIVCKVLEVFPDHLNLSLRRVSSKEKNEILNSYKKEKDFENALKSLLKENSSEIIEKIKKDFKTLTEFFNTAEKENKIIESYIPLDLKENFEKILIKKKKNAEKKAIINLNCFSEDGIEKIKKVLSIEKEGISIKYIAAGKFLLTIIDEDFKKADSKLRVIKEELEKKAKKENCVFSMVEQ